MRSSRLAALTLAGLAAVAAAGVALTVLDQRGWPRAAVVGLVLAGGPGWALVGLLRVRDTAMALTVALAATLALDTGVAMAMLGLDAWSPRAGAAAVCALTAVLALAALPGTRRPELGAARPVPPAGAPEPW